MGKWYVDVVVPPLLVRVQCWLSSSPLLVMSLACVVVDVPPLPPPSSPPLLPLLLSMTLACGLVASSDRAAPCVSTGLGVLRQLPELLSSARTAEGQLPAVGACADGGLRGVAQTRRGVRRPRVPADACTAPRPRCVVRTLALLRVFAQLDVCGCLVNVEPRFAAACGQVASNAVHYVLGLWSRLVSAVPYVRVDTTADPMLDTYAPKVGAA